MTILIRFQQSQYRTCKAFSLQQVQRYWHDEFPRLVSYTRFVELLPSVLVPLTVYLQTPRGEWTGISCIDSTALAVCHNARIRQHRVFARDAARGKTSVDWFYGCKLHLVVNDRGELLACCLTRGHGDDRRPVPRLVRRLFGTLFGDRGSISQELAETRFVRQGLRLITKRRKHMRSRLVAMTDTLLVRKRAIIETIYDQLKHICQIEHSRHRSPRNLLVHLIAGLIAYCHQPKKPSLDLNVPTFPLAALIPN
jgi:Transposase DDE domain